MERSCGHRIRTQPLTFSETLLSDAQQLMARESVHFLSGCAVPKEHPITGDSHDFLLSVSAEMDQMPSHDDRKIVDGMSPDIQSDEVLTMRNYLARLVATLERFQRPNEKNLAHPWVEHFLPISAVPEYFEVVKKEFPKDVLLLWPIRTAKLRQPMLCLPAVDEVVLVGILCSRRLSDLAEVLPRLRKVDELGVALGGKRYLSGWLDFDIDRWSQHYGVERWKEVISLQRKYDPVRLFRLWERTTE